MPGVPMWFVLLECEVCGHMEQATATHSDQTWKVPEHCGLPLKVAAAQLVVPASRLLT